MIKAYKIILSVFLIASTIISACACSNSGDNDKKQVKNEMREITTMELIKEMGIGINLGNTLEACGSWISPTSVQSYETAWGSPVVTEDMILGYKEIGFNVVRIPVAWSNLMSEDYTISAELMSRVKEVVDYVINNDMYAILNIHYDGGWFSKFTKEYDECMKKYTRVWEQISENFKDYGDFLMFESLNEEGCFDDLWNRYGGTEGKEDAYEILNNMNQKFTDIVRASGSNNEKRHLLIAGYATDITLTCDPFFEMPNDPQNRCAVSVHYYTPPTFAILEKDASWGKVKTTWGKESEIKELEKYMDMMKTTFIDKGIPVIVGEYGLYTKNKEEDQIVNYLITVCRTALDRGLCPVLWDVEGGGLYNRNLKKITIAPLEEEYKKIAAELAQP